MLSLERPTAPVLAFTDSRALYRRMALLHAVRPQLGVTLYDNTDMMLDYMLTEAKERGGTSRRETRLWWRGLVSHDVDGAPSFISVLRIPPAELGHRG